MKKAVSLFLVLTMAAGLLTGCGSTGKEGATSTDSNKESNASTEGTICIGGIGPLTGGAAIYGKAAQNGAQIAVDEINKAGGIGGSLISYKFEDDENDPEKAVNAYNTLKDWGMQILYGNVTTGSTLAVIDKTASDGIYQITPSASAADVIKSDNVFQVCFSDPNQGTASAKYIGENKIASKVAVIYDSSDVYSTGIYNNFSTESKNQGFEIVSAQAFTADSKTDFSVQIQGAKDAGAELVFLPIYYTEAAIVLKQASDIGFAPKFFGCDGLDGLLSVENFDAALAEGVMLLTPFAADAEDEITKKFVTAYKEAYNDTPNQFAADGYDAIYTIKAAAEKAGIKPDMSPKEIGTAMKAAMAEITVDGITGQGMVWDGGAVSKDPKAVVIEGGAYKAM